MYDVIGILLNNDSDISYYSTNKLSLKRGDVVIVDESGSSEYDADLIEKINTLDKKVEDKMNKLEIGASLDLIFDLLRRSNKYIDETTPWVLVKNEENKEKLETVIYNLLESIRVSAIELAPFLPDTSNKIFEQLNINSKEEKYVSYLKYETSTPTPLFQRIDKEAKLKEIEEAKKLV